MFINVDISDIARFQTMHVWSGFLLTWFLIHNKQVIMCMCRWVGLYGALDYLTSDKIKGVINQVFYI